MSFSDRDQVRLHIGDTDSDDPILFDEEIDNFLDSRAVLDPATGGTVYVNIEAAAADAAGAIAAEYARQFDFSEDGQTFQRAQRIGNFKAIERDLRNRAGGYAVPTGGTIS